MSGDYEAEARRSALAGVREMVQRARLQRLRAKLPKEPTSAPSAAADGSGDALARLAELAGAPPPGPAER